MLRSTMYVATAGSFLRSRTWFAAAPSSRRRPSRRRMTASSGDSRSPASVRSRISSVRMFTREILAGAFGACVSAPRRWRDEAAGTGCVLGELERAGGGNEPVLGGQSVEEIQSCEVSGVQLVVERVAQIVLQDRLGEARLGCLPRDQAREVAPAGVIGRPDDLRRFPFRQAVADRPEREDERMAGEGPPLRGEVEDDVAVQTGLQRRIADDQ